MTPGGCAQARYARQCPAARALWSAQSLPRKLGVVETGALADLLLVDGDPIAYLDLVADPGKNFKVIMKDGRVYKNTL